MSRASKFDLGISGTTVFSNFLLLASFFVDEALWLFAECSESVAVPLFFVRLLGVLGEVFLPVAPFFLVCFFWVGSGRFLRFLCEFDPAEAEEDTPSALGDRVKHDKSRAETAASAAFTAAATAS